MVFFRCFHPYLKKEAKLHQAKTSTCSPSLTLCSMAEVTRSRMLFAGAGAAIQFPLNHSRSSVSSSSSSAAAAASSTETRNAYLVTPAAHIGRVVTGVVFIAQQTRLLNREFTQGVASQNGSVVEEFGLATISFADKLAEQGYKVFVLNVFPEKAKADSDDVVDEQMRVVEQAVFFLKQKQDIQRVALCGFGPGADLAIKMSIERPALLDCSIMMCPNGNLAWTKPEGAPTPAPMLLLVGDKNPFSQSQAVRILCSPRSIDPVVDAQLSSSACLCSQFQQLTDTFAADTNTAVSSPILRSRVFPNQDKGFAFSYITDEDAATQAIAEILDWLVTHLHRFRAAAGTSDGDPWCVSLLICVTVLGLLILKYVVVCYICTVGGHKDATARSSTSASRHGRTQERSGSHRPKRGT